VVDAAGNVGIGTTTPAANGLDVVRNGATALVRVLQSDSGAGTFARLLVSKTSGPSVETLLDSAAAYFGTVGSHPLLIETNATERVRITASGLVGINTSTPDANLTVNGVASFSAGTALLPSIAQAGDLNTGMWFPAADTLAWSTAGTERLRIGASGAITLPDLTASTALALDASKNVVSVTNTGTGSNVLATSPTLVTPNLGTPSAIVLTNASGTASININGTVGATTPTTGAFTTLSASGVASFAAGTQLLPSLAGPTDPDTGMWFPAANTVAWSTGGSERMRITSAGEVGIGTSTPTGFIPLTILANSSNAIALNIRGRSDGIGVLLFSDNSDVENGRIDFRTNYAEIKQTRNAPLVFSTNGSEKMRLTAAGDLGLGTTPGGGMKLDILGGNVNLTNATYAAYQAVSGTVTGQLAANASGTVDIRAVSNHPLLLYTNNGERMRISATGEVGIGKTAATGVLLDVNGPIHATTLLQLTNGFASVSLREAAGGIGYRWTLANNGTYRLQRTANGTYSDATQPILMDASCVGLGSLNSQTWAFSNGSGGAAFSWNRSNGSAEMNIVNQYDNAALSFEFAQKTGASTASVLYSFGTSSHQWYVSGAEKMRIDSAGDVGINESDPDYKLDVNGTFGFTPGASVTPVDNGDVVFEATNNTTFTVKLKGSDGTVRTGTITLA